MSVPFGLDHIGRDTDTQQAKLNSIHEIVLKNRLEQFKRRQREDAAKVQAELGGVLVSNENAFGGDIHADAGPVPTGGDEADDEEEDEDEVNQGQAKRGKQL